MKRGTRPKRVRIGGISAWLPPELCARVENICREFGLSRKVVLEHLLERGVEYLESLPPKKLRQALALPEEELRRRIGGMRPSNGRRA